MMLLTLRRINLSPMKIHIRKASMRNVLRKKLPTDLAMEHFDNVYEKVYKERWPSIRLGLSFETKNCAVVNPFTDPKETFEDLKLQGAIELSELYTKQAYRVERYKMRMKILEEKKEKKRAILAEKRGIKVEEIKSDIEASDLSGSEMEGGTTTDPEMYSALFETDVEALRHKEGFMQANVQGVDLYDFIPCSELIYREEQLITDHALQYRPVNLQLDLEMEEVDKLEFPENLKVFTFPRGSLLTFEPPTAKNPNCLNDYYLIDGGQILPVITLNIQPGEKVADICAAPGGKALAAFFTMRPSVLFGCDKNESNYIRMKNFFDSYVPITNQLRDSVLFECVDALQVDCVESFDKVLVDAPSTYDRMALLFNEDNIFHNTQAQFRQSIPDKQKELLKCGLKLLKKGGSLVYSTSTLSPLQNDYVVYAALKEFSNQSSMKFTISSLKEAFRPLRVLYRMYTFQYGIQVLPFLPSNFGPVYFSKINRKE